MFRFLKQRISPGPLLAVLMITLTALLAVGIFIPRLGYYHDDWYMLWSGISRGAGSLFDLFISDRPFIGFIYVRAFGILRDSIPGWHLSALAARIATAIAFYWILTLAWPRLNRLFVLAAMLFLTFPGFLSQPNAATKINHLLGYGAALFSIAFTLQAARTSRRVWKFGWTALALVAMAFYLWIYEYMIGLEVMRVVLLYWLHWQGRRANAGSALKQTILAYLPYIPVAAGFLYWRTSIFESTRNATNVEGLVGHYTGDPASMLLRLVFQGLNDFLSTSIFAWFVQPYHLLDKASYGRIAIALLTAAAAALLALGYLAFTRRPGGEDASAQEDATAPSHLILIGSLITLGAVFPVVLTNHYLDLMDPYKSYGLHPSAGVIILLLGAVLLLKPRYRNGVLVALLALSVGAQSLNAQDWAFHWDLQRSFWWQLTWRAPQIQDNTMVMALAPGGYGFQQDYEVWGPVNLIYRQERQMTPLIQSEVLNEDTALFILERKTFPIFYARDILVPRDYTRLLLISQPTTASCIHVIDGKMPAYSASERLLIKQVGQYSNLDLIDPSAAPPAPPPAIFGQEPEHGWCYAYQQASLARQRGDWARIAALYDAASASGLKPGDPSEYFVFIEGLTNAGRAGDARAIASQEIKKIPALRYSLCQSLAAAPEYPASFGYRRDAIEQVVCEVAE